MLNQVTILGRVTEVYEDRDEIFVVVKTGGGKKRDGGGRWEELVACRFWGDAKKWCKDISPGAFVKVDASAKSRRSDKGGVFTNIEARYLRVMAGAPPVDAPASKGGKGKTDPPPSDDDLDNVPF